MTGRPDGAPARDPLDRIEAAVVRWCSDPATPDNAIPASPDEVLALVAVARAAEELFDERGRFDVAYMPALREALSRLGGDQAGG